MAQNVVRIPVAGMVMTEGEVVDVFVALGDQVAVGDEICSVEFEKSVVGVESDFAGEVVSLQVTEGQLVEPGDEVAVIDG